MKIPTRFSFISGTILISLLLLPLSLDSSGEVWTQGEMEEFTVDEIIVFSFVVFNESHTMDDVRLVMDDEYIEVNNSMPFHQTDEGWMVRCEVELVIGAIGEHELGIQHLINGTWYDSGTIDINIISDKKDDDEKTIFGLPRWYCSVSIIGITIIVIFFTWSYFKGRKMQKEKVMATGNTSIQCSECGKDVGTEEKFCPWCGVSLDEEEFVCGKCNKPVSKSDIECPNCETKLLKQKEKPKVSIDEKPKKKKSKDIEMKEKRTCDKCGTVLMKKEKVCPICGKKEI